MSFQQQNDKRISAGLAKVKARVRQNAYAAVDLATESGFYYAQDIHSAEHKILHISFGGNFGMGVAEDGKIKRVKMVAGSADSERSAEREIGLHLEDSIGIVGVVSAGMDDAHYDRQFEEETLITAARFARKVLISNMRDFKLKNLSK